MRTTKILLALFFASALIFSMSCSKNIDNTHTYEYKIEDFDEFCVEVTFFNTDGQMITTSDPAVFLDGKKTLTVTKPFFGGFMLKVDNSSTSDRSYELSIVIDGETKVSKTMVVPAFAVQSDNLEYNFK